MLVIIFKLREGQLIISIKGSFIDYQTSSHRRPEGDPMGNQKVLLKRPRFLAIEGRLIKARMSSHTRTEGLPIGDQKVFSSENGIYSHRKPVDSLNWNIEHQSEVN